MRISMQSVHSLSQQRAVIWATETMAAQGDGNKDGPSISISAPRRMAESERDTDRMVKHCLGKNLLSPNCDPEFNLYLFRSWYAQLNV